MRLCSGCGTKIPDETRGRCAECEADSKSAEVDDGIRSHSPIGAVASRDKYAHMYQDARWKKCSRIQRQSFPMCEQPGCKRLAEIADHHIPAVVYIELCRAEKRFLIAEMAFFDMSNLRSLCRICHADKSEEDMRRIAAGGPWERLGRPARKWSF
jgi:hypothetical protein